MAKIDFSGTDEAVRLLKKSDLFTDDNIKRLLVAGTKVLYNDISSAFIAGNHIRTGATMRHLTRSRKISRDKHDVPYMYVTVTGKDERGQKYNIKAFTMNYGRRHGGKIPATYYWSNAVQSAWQKANDKMADEAAEILKEQ